MGKQERNSRIELLRILAMLIIVISHYRTHGVGDLTKACVPGSFNYYFLMHCCINLGTVIFALLFGYFAIRSNFSLRKAGKLWLTVWTYSVPIYLIFVAAGKVKFTAEGLEEALLPIIHRQYWFISVYLILLLFTPYLNRLLLELDRRDYQRLLLTMLLLFGLIPMVFEKGMYANELVQFVMLYALGGYLRLYWAADPKYGRLARQALPLIILAYAAVSWFMLGVLGNSTVYLRTRSSLFIVGIGCCLVLIAVHARPFSSRVINTVAGSAFGVYLIHDNPLVRPWLWKLLGAKAHAKSPYLVFHLLGCAIAVFVVCLGIDLVKSRLVDRPLFRLADRIHFPEAGVSRPPAKTES